MGLYVRTHLLGFQHRAAAVVESKALLLPPPLPPGPLQQHGRKRPRLRPVHAAGVGQEAQDNVPSSLPSPTILIGGGAADDALGHRWVFPS